MKARTQVHRLLRAGQIAVVRVPDDTTLFERPNGAVVAWAILKEEFPPPRWIGWALQFGKSEPYEIPELWSYLARNGYRQVSEARGIPALISDRSAMTIVHLSALPDARIDDLIGLVATLLGMGTDDEAQLRGSHLRALGALPAGGSQRVRSACGPDWLYFDLGGRHIADKSG